MKDREVDIIYEMESCSLTTIHRRKTLCEFYDSIIHTKRFL